MLDGRVDTQGTVKELRAQGVLDDIAQDAAIEVKEEEGILPASRASSSEDSPLALDDAAKADAIKKPRKLVKDEHREEGGVKWSIYKSYLKASYVVKFLFIYSQLIGIRSYWIWGFLALLVLLNQVLGITEKLWIKVIDALPLLGLYHIKLTNHDLDLG